MPKPFRNAAREVISGDKMHRITVEPLVASGPFARDYKMRFSGNPGFKPLDLSLQPVQFFVHRFYKGVLIKNSARSGTKSPLFYSFNRNRLSFA